ncbi:MAG: peptidoglycan DD-metalloendopeptidase family protein [Candidatus Krumholzibacteria bacterium]|nr:peptidoglycan DD-metalloendopeptidase family protein [Candidatus Krumholzibacteria bacterium]MDH4336286.1 peptidoglycan DD-metalloendopeptidase family protein [Candidatus Krumholzibacteria bacterium]MDH5269675.1 peptidoglycan DD-metalloendopeptidase family protein [Candidatus Krumholzibacteria bacterium]
MIRIPDRILTFLYLPEGSNEPRTFRVRRNALAALAAVVTISLGVSGWVVLHYSSRLMDAYTVEALETQNSELKSELAALGTEVETLRRQVAQNFDFQKKARILANMDELDEDVAQVGVGGTGFSSAQLLTSVGPEERARLAEARRDIDKLLRQARLQKTDYESILGELEGANEKLRTTPSLRPVNVGFVSSRFGWRMDPMSGRRTMHRGLDFSARLGTPVYATADGVVTFSGVWRTYGNVVEISHGGGFVTRFAHMQRRLVQKGQRVTRGDVIGRVGSTGRSTFSHLHYEIEKDGERVDPTRFVLAD